MKRKKILTRKERAIRLAAAALGMLFYANYACNTGYLLPIQAVSEETERIGAGKLETVEWRLDPEMDEFLYSGQICLLANSYVTALVDISFSPLNGWWAWYEPLLTTEDEERILYVGAESYNSIFPRDREPGEPWDEILYIFGRVDDPEIQCLEFEIRNGENGEKISYITSTRSDWTTEGAYTYFLVRHEFEGSRGKLALLRTIAYDATGNVVTTVNGGT